MNLIPKKITIDQQKGRLSEEEIKKIVEEGEKFKSEDEEIRKKITAKNDLENYAYQMKNTLDDKKFKDIIKEEDRKKVQNKVKEVIEWVDNNANATVDEFEGKKKELEDLWKPIIMDAYKSTGGGPMPGGMPNMGEFDQQPTTEPTNKGPDIDDVD